ncbi:MAG: DNA-methyltransferase [Hyphomicrobiales bacterium]
MRRFEVIHGRVEDALPTLDEASFDGVLCDPPYALSSQRWDDPGRQRVYKARTDAGYGNKGHMKGYGRGGTPQDRVAFRSRTNMAFHAWTVTWATATLHVVKPGAWLIAFGAPRTVHRLAVGIEDAGWEVRDNIAWEHGHGVPKSRTTELRPTHEPIVLARKPLTESTVPLNVQRWGVGDLRTDGASHPENVLHHPKPSKSERSDSGHPTPKPIGLCSQLAHLILPARGCGRLLVPFAGSGSEMLGALDAGWDDVVGVEQSSEYVTAARRRLGLRVRSQQAAE